MQFGSISMGTLFVHCTGIIKEYYPYLKEDMGDVVEFILPAILVGMVCTILIMLVMRMITHRWNWKKTFVYFLFLSYVVIVILIAYLSRQPGSRADVALGLGDTWGATFQAHAYVMENVIMFIPFGLIFPMLGKYARVFCVPAALCSSMAIEGMQFLSQRGYCQLDDVVTNVIGACIGYGIYLIGYRIHVRISKLKKETAR